MPRPLRHLLPALIATAALTSSLAAGCRSAPGARAMDQLIRARFPGVATVTTDSLATWLTRPLPQRPLLFDIRAADEYAVSHLQGARRADPTAAAFAAILATVSRTHRPVVVYCSVGYRSAEFAAGLTAAATASSPATPSPSVPSATPPSPGAPPTAPPALPLRVWNLEGGIFRWANQGRPLYRDGKQVHQVHPYDPKWGALLAPELHAQ